MEIENNTIWDPSFQLGTPWVANAKSRDVDIIFWLCFVKIIFGVLSGLATRLSNIRTKTVYTGVYRDEEGVEVELGLGQRHVSVSVGADNGYSINIMQTVMPILGICAIKLDCLEILKAFGIATVTGVVLVGLAIFFTIWSFCQIILPSYGTQGPNCGSMCICLLMVIAAGLQITGIIFTWPNAFSGESFEKEIEKEIPKIPTFGGNSDGAPCHFPFLYKGKNYTTCTDAGIGSKLWCSTTANYGEDKIWGKCVEIPQIEIPNINIPNLPNVDLSNWPISTGMENIAKIQTYGGNSNGAACHFPFTYKNKVYTECTDVGSIGSFLGVSSKSWCSTTPNYEEDKKWGKCIEIPQIKIPTFGGNANGAPCHFPFLYKGKTYTTCTDAGVGSKFWCSTTPNYDEDKIWGKCFPKIPQIPQIEIPQIDLNDMDWKINVKHSG